MVRISVCLPVYNGERFLAQAIESVLAQTYGDFELIVIDDCSTDASPAIAERYAAQDSRIRLLKNESNVGLFQNYNRCLQEANGEFIKPFAQDDLLAPTMFERMIERFEANPSVALMSVGKRWLSESGETLQSFKLFPKDTMVSGKEVIRYNLIGLNNWVGEPSTVMYRAAHKGTGFDTTLFHYGDIEYWFRIAENHDYLYLAEELCGFRRHRGSATSKNLSGLYFALDILNLGKKYRGYLEEIGETPEHFSKRAMEVISLHVDHLVRKENLDLQACLRARPSQMPIDEARAFKQLSFEAGRYIVDLLSRISALEHQLEDQRSHFEAQIKNIHESSSWKITAPLRRIVRPRAGSS